ncbi:DUF4255 domain-containing protein [Pandoraea sputorum]|uniref:Pvc16 N-terminal domain-containing protein n=1 Tax=Pandoraea sputorum TaxID=93222 RepID=A0A5E4T672_9BURK|nr:DUF4255 domain-containing protein [Pandoraea sputorum]VVD83335.1 hypothetical protein PSP20601_01225 [Pandoraea sputorum]VVE77635.1 hypothetical protein PSP31121_01210 [Pandoraea sputorum]
MINAAVGHLAGRLNEHLKQTYTLDGDIVTMSGLVDVSGQAVANTSNRLVVMLTHIERDSGPVRKGIPGDAGASSLSLGVAPLYLNLYVMVAANFSGGHYEDSLKLISAAIAFFQRNPVFDHRSSPSLDPRIDRLMLEIENLDIRELSNLWTMLGGKYLPSVLYKVRLMAPDTGDITGTVPTVRAPVPAISH